MGLSLEDRMKSYYEKPYRIYLTHRTPVIIRVDARAGSSFTKHLAKPWDSSFGYAMQSTMKFLCENIQGCVFGYTQSDEISLVVIDYQSLDYDAFFANNLNKIVSLSASMATLEFNRAFDYWGYQNLWFDKSGKLCDKNTLTDEGVEYEKTLDKCLARGLCFDSRAFNVPREEVCNYFIWRQNDASRNSILMLAQDNFSHKQIEGLSCDELQEKLLIEKNVNWKEVATMLKRGSCYWKDICGDNKWKMDTEIPIFSRERDYIDDLVYCDYEKE